MDMDKIIKYILGDATESELKTIYNAYRERTYLLRAMNIAKSRMALRKGMKVITKGLKKENGELYTIVKVNQKRAVCRHESTNKQYHIPLQCLEEAPST